MIPKHLEFLLLLLLTGTASGQLDLPGKAGSGQPGPAGPAKELAPPSAPRGDLAPKGKVNPLDLPGKPAAAPTASTAEPIQAGPEGAARFIFTELARGRELRLAERAVESLLAIGPDALPIARSELGSAQPLVLLAAGRTLLVGGSNSDRAAVVERLARPLPAEVGPALLEELLARDPMLASPEFLAGLLEHPTAALRTAAAKALEARLSPALLPALAPLFSSTRAAARAAVLELVARVDDPAATHLLVSRLGDPTAQLAARAAELLSTRAAAEGILLARAFPAQDASALDWDRTRAYALLALVEREESQGIVLLDETRIETLRAGLAGSNLLVSGVCAVALARIGFRAPASHTGSWLDREVPHQLVRAGTGAEFHADFSALERPALRALALLSGEFLAQDGEAWRRWWVDAADGFHARHGTIELAADAAEQLVLEFADGQGAQAGLRSAELPDTDVAAGSDPVLLLDGATEARLLTRLEQAGVFGGQRPPSAAREAGGRSLSVTIGAQSKRFAFSAGVPVPWFDELLRDLDAIRSENRWQLLFDPARTTRRDWWQSEHERWAAYAPLERQRAEKGLLLAAARRTQGAERSARLAELARLDHEVGVSEASDLEPLLELLAAETSFGPDAQLLCELARIAAGTGAAEAASPASPACNGHLRLLALCLEHFGPEADAALVRVARELASEGLVTLARDARPRARALAAPGLLRTGSQADHGLVLALLADPEPSVVQATLAALAAAPFEEARSTLIELEKKGSVALRAAALTALAHLGGAGVFDLALGALAEGDEVLQRAAVATLAELADPRSASLLAALLARGSSSPLFADARRGLLRLGATGVDECLRLSHSANGRTRREAALLLAEERVPEAAGLLLTLLTEDPRDERVAWELAVVTCQDLRSAEHPETAWWNWWDMVVHDDPLAWLLASAQRAGFEVPAREVLGDHASAEGARFLLRLLDAPEPALVERAARELEQRLGVELTRPANPAQDAAWRAEVAEAVRAHFGT